MFFGQQSKNREFNFPLQRGEKKVLPSIRNILSIKISQLKKTADNDEKRSFTDRDQRRFVASFFF